MAQHTLAIAFAIDDVHRVRNFGEDLWRAAHSLKASAENLGVRAVAHHCREVEMRGRDGALAGVGGILDSLDIRLADAIRSLGALSGEV